MPTAGGSRPSGSEPATRSPGVVSSTAPSRTAAACAGPRAESPGTPCLPPSTRVGGAWRVELAGGRSFDVTIAQHFQKIEGKVALGPVEAGLREAALRGDAIRFGFVDADGAWYEAKGAGLRRPHVRHIPYRRPEGNLDRGTALDQRLSAMRRGSSRRGWSEWDDRLLPARRVEAGAVRSQR